MSGLQAEDSSRASATARRGSLLAEVGAGRASWAGKGDEKAGKSADSRRRFVPSPAGRR